MFSNERTAPAIPCNPISATANRMSGKTWQQTALPDGHTIASPLAVVLLTALHRPCCRVASWPQIASILPQTSPLPLVPLSPATELLTSHPVDKAMAAMSKSVSISFSRRRRGQAPIAALGKLLTASSWRRVLLPA